MIPATWAILLDRIFGINFFKTTFAAFAFKVFSSVDFPVFADWLFGRSAQFLNSFRDLGGDYVMMSVIVCVLIPLVVYTVLAWFAVVRALTGICTDFWFHDAETIDHD